MPTYDTKCNKQIHHDWKNVVTKMQKGKSKGQNMRIIIIDRITNVCEMRNEVTAWSTGVYRVTCKVHLKLLWTCQQY